MQKLASKVHAWKRAAGYFSVESRGINLMVDHVWRQDVRCDVVTFMHGPPFAQAVLEQLEELGVPVTGASYEISPGYLGRRLAHMPDVLAVYDGNKRRCLSYGSRGRHLAT